MFHEICWLPRRRRACPSAALDERVDGNNSSLPYPAIVSISVCLPARDEAATIGPIVAEVVGLPAVDEVVVIDDGSTDDTAAVASTAGARVVHEADVLPEAGPGRPRARSRGRACRG